MKNEKHISFFTKRRYNDKNIFKNDYNIYRKSGIVSYITDKKEWRSSMNGRMNTQFGQVVIDTNVIAKYAGTLAVECFGIVGMASVNMKDGLVKLLKGDSLTHGITVEIEDNKITIDFHVIVVYGVSISTVADNLIQNVKYKIEEFTGMEVEKINILVEGVRVID